MEFEYNELVTRVNFHFFVEGRINDVTQQGGFGKDGEPDNPNLLQSGTLNPPN